MTIDKYKGGILFEIKTKLEKKTNRHLSQKHNNIIL